MYNYINQIASTLESGVLFANNPSSRDGTRLSDAALSCAVGLRLGADVAATARCVCGSFLDSKGDHALSCKKSVGRHARHAEVNARIKRALVDAGVASTLEPIGLDTANGKRLDGSTILPFARGKEMAWDATISHTCAPSYMSIASTSARAVASRAEANKDKKYSSLTDRVDFRAVGLETLGAFGPSAQTLFDDIASRIRTRTGHSGARSLLYRKIAAAIQIGNAACILEAHSYSR